MVARDQTEFQRKVLRSLVTSAVNIFILGSFEPAWPRWRLLREYMQQRKREREREGEREVPGRGRGKIEHSPEELVCTGCEIGYFLTVLYIQWRERVEMSHAAHVRLAHIYACMHTQPRASLLFPLRGFSLSSPPTHSLSAAPPLSLSLSLSVLVSLRHETAI